MGVCTTITKRYAFEAGHWLPYVPEGHKCRRKHGHNYEVDISVVGLVQDNGFVLDFYDLDKIVHPLIARLDHRMLNEIEGLTNPTAEIIAHWFVRRVNTDLPSHVTVSKVTVYETKNCIACVEVV
jgi:6-pyruvoyltetrahydropterin/6-carboxytetrahydropterin synthase